MAWRVCHFWGIDKPKVKDGKVYFAFTKLGKYFMLDGEGWIIESDNLLTERDPDKLAFKLLPDGVGVSGGIRQALKGLSKA